MSVEAVAGVTQTYQEIPRKVQAQEMAGRDAGNAGNAGSTVTVLAQTSGIQPIFSEDKEGGREEKNKNQASDKQMQMAVSDANTKMRHSKTKAEFSYHEPTKSVSIRIMDEDTNEVIKEIPPEETLDMIVKMWELAGIMVDEKR